MRPQRGTESPLWASRGQSETIGVVLVFAMMIAGASIVVIFGVSAVGDSEQALSSARAEKTLTQLDSRAALVALDNTDIQQVDFPDDGEGRFRVQNGTGSLNVTVWNSTSLTRTHIVNQSLGRVIFDNGRGTIAYQGGGVWRSAGDGSVMVSPPEFHYRDGTLTLPVINVSGSPALDGGAGLSHTATARVFPRSDLTDRQNPLDQHRVLITLRSDYYEAWGQYFEERTDGIVSYNHAENKAILELASPIGRQRITSAAASRAASGTFELHGAASTRCGTDVYTNSYNSSGTSNDYCAQVAAGTTGAKGDLVYGEDVDISYGSGGSNIYGDVSSGGSVTVTASGGGGQPDVYGNISHTDQCNPTLSDCEDRIISPTGSRTVISGVDTMHNINLLVMNRVDEIQSDNDNGGAAISGNTLDFGASSPSDEVTLTAGTYYLEDLEVDGGETLTLDTSTGMITIAVRGGVHLEESGGGLGDGGTIDVQGDGAVQFYLRGDDSIHGRSDDLLIGKNAAVLAPNDNATQFRLYGPDDLEAQIGSASSNLAKYVGVIFTPPGVAGTARVDIGGGEVYGGVLTGTTTIDSGSIHYDEALAQKQIIARNAKVVRVTFLHVTINRLHVEDG